MNLPGHFVLHRCYFTWNLERNPFASIDLVQQTLFISTQIKFLKFGAVDDLIQNIDHGIVAGELLFYPKKYEEKNLVCQD